ncbi:putative membrane protein YesL [Evansella vedderi]|uniref:Membrane protein YesL n=1 Tax=Evansella vedderi TaxID=38282 RepID=A0ABU0A309_9BACI|nr:DUF624 domain-containing protein [Evansella vedderi]MDQ0257351.1 putative membrane protein YesL [Evansella vedderi]
MNQGTMSGFMNGFYRYGEYFILLLYLNLLWLCFTLLGGIVFGWAPSTTAMFAVLRQWIKGEEGPVFTTFWKTYRQEFLRSNGLGIMIVVMAYVLYVNLQFFYVETTWLFVAVRFMMIAIMITSSVMLLYIFPLMVHYEASLFRLIKNAWIMVILKPFRTLFTVGACVIVTQILFVFPILIIFLGVSLTGLVIMWTTHFTFRSIEQKQKELQEQESI